MDTHANTGEILEEMYDKVWSFESVLVPLSGEKEKKKKELIWWKLECLTHLLIVLIGGSMFQSWNIRRNVW